VTGVSIPQPLQSPCRFPAGSATSAAVSLVVLVLTLSALPGRAQSVPESDQPPEQVDEILSELTDSFDDEHFADCEGVPSLVLNEVCAVGTECDVDVRIADYVELYNPSGRVADLSCFALLSDEGILFSPSGDLEGGEVEAWGEQTLGFRISKAEDQVALIKLGTEQRGPSYRVLESLVIRASRAHAIRLPDGGAWTYTERDDAEDSHRGTFGRSNSEEPTR